MAEHAFLRHPLARRHRSVTRPRCTPAERALLVRLASRVRAWRSALHLVQPDTLLRWQRELFRGSWRRKSRAAAPAHRPPLAPHRQARLPRRAGQRWATFQHHHAPDIWACDCLPVTALLFRPLFACVVSALGSRRVVHVGVTRHPTDA